MSEHPNHSNETVVNEVTNEIKKGGVFDPLEASKILKAQARERGQRRLSITDQYNAFALIKSGVSRGVVAKMYGLSTTSISHMANCLARKPGSVWRYVDVHNEWRRLGEESFMKAYLTEENYLKAQRLKYGVDDNADDDRMQLHLTSNPRADSCSYGLIGSIDLDGWKVRIDFVMCEDPDITYGLRGPEGWRYAPVNPSDYPSGPYVGIAPYDEPIREDGVWMPWRTSADCCNHLHKIMGLKSPFRGRPRKTIK